MLPWELIGTAIYLQAGASPPEIGTAEWKEFQILSTPESADTLSSLAACTVRENGAEARFYNSIDFSMRINHADCPGMYGDFGRYVFQAALEKFEAVDVVNMYHYAMQYIRDTLGYSDQLFGDYERFRAQRNYSRHENKKIERIGKKYQWIAFYNILARVSDAHMLKDWSEPPYPYEGAWEPYVRDFDPTLNINFLKPEFIPEIQYPQSEEQLFLQIEPLPSETEIQEWTKQPTSFFENLPGKLILVDSDGTEWINLNLYDNFKTKKFENDGIGFSKGSQEIWLTAHGYFVEPEILETLKKQFTAGFFDRDFPQRLDVYQLFNREYSWSPGYQSVFQASCFEAEIEIGEKRPIKETVEMPVLVQTETGDIEFRVTEQEIERFVPEDVIHIKVIPAYSHLLWEEEYDASQEDTTAFDVPCREIIDYFHLEQKEYDGKRTQKVKIVFNFLEEVEVPEISKPVITETTYERRKTA